MSTLTEIVGFKCGIDVGRENLSEYVPERFRGIWTEPGDAIIRLHSTEFEQLVTGLLHRLGTIEQPYYPPTGMATFQRFGQSEAGQKLLADISHRWRDFYKEAADKARAGGANAIDPLPFLRTIGDVHGSSAVRVAQCYIAELQSGLERSPWSTFRSVNFTDTVQLKDLFESEALGPSYGRFIDQRFIDFLSRNFDRIDDIHWRKFEALASEFFTRADFHVVIGPGRDDGGVDIRVWPNESSSKHEPPTLLVQCKRQKDKVSKVVVKALWADVVNEHASSGLVVTTSAFSPGAKAVCEARAYPVREADRATVKQWVLSMRTPGTGLFMAE